MKTLFHHIAAGLGFFMLLSTAAIVSHPAVILTWVATAILLLRVGRAFTFQQKQQ